MESVINRLMSHTIAEMMGIALDAYILSFHSCKANDECRVIRDELEATGVETIFGSSLASMDPFKEGYTCWIAAQHLHVKSLICIVNWLGPVSEIGYALNEIDLLIEKL